MPDGSASRLGWPSIAEPLSIRLFGQFQASWRGRQVLLEGRPARALFALVVLRPRPWGRDEVTAEIWPDAPFGPSARLRQALWLVRKGLNRAGIPPAELLDVDDDTIGLRSGIGVSTDVAQFEECLRRRPPAVDAALGLYGGDFAEALGLECLAARREYLADLYEDALASAAKARIAAGDLDGARILASTLLERDAYREEAHEVLIDVYGRSGSRSQVHRQYRRLRRLLATELGVVPLPETTASYLVALARTTERSARVAALAANEAEVPTTTSSPVGVS